MSVVAAIDVGTNSFHLVVAEAGDNGGFEVLARERERVRLGEGAFETGRLSSAAIDRGVEALDRMRRIAAEAGAIVVAAVATSAVREAANGWEFLRRARREALVEVEVVAGVEEARLIHRGVLGSVPLDDTRHLVVDIGGGSTEFVVGDGSEVLLARSLKLGHIRLTDRFFPDGRSCARSERDCRDHAASGLGEAAAEIAELGFEMVIGTSGTLAALGRICALRRGEWVNGTANRLPSFGASELSGLTADLVNARTQAERLQIDGVTGRRAETIVGGAVLADVIFELAGIEAMGVTDFALREGILFTQIDRIKRSVSAAASR